jgi:hypothetical protein
MVSAEEALGSKQENHMNRRFIGNKPLSVPLIARLHFQCGGGKLKKFAACNLFFRLLIRTVFALNTACALEKKDGQASRAWPSFFVFFYSIPIVAGY